MRHLRQKFTLGRERGPRKALMRGLAESLVLHEKIITTKAKARALRMAVEPLVTKAKKNDLNARRAALRILYTDKAVKKLMETTAPKYKDRKGGYTRIIKLSRRPNDRAERVRIEFV